MPLPRSIVLTTLVALAVGLVPAPASAAPPGECADIMPISQVEAGMRGRGWTVAQGQTRQRFRAKVLGILDDGIAPGRDMIMVEVSDVAGSDIIAKAGGIWAGMSGSPVYVNGKLIGAVAFGLTFGPSRVGGLTPAQDMARVLSYGGPAAAADASLRVSSVTVSPALRREVAEAAGVSPSRATSFQRLPLPLAVSGLSQRRREVLQQSLDRAGIPAVVTAGSRARRSAGGVFATPVPGGNFAGLLSYGDITAGGVGTTTYVCGGQALAFGHPLLFIGRTAMGANDADAIAIIADPVFGPFKLANVGGMFGTLDQDRLAAVRADLGVAPSLIPITSDVTDLDLGQSRLGRSDSTLDEFVPDISFLQLVSNIDVTIDRIGEGSSWVRFVVDGQRANGDPWTLTRRNRFASDFDISFDSVFEMLEYLAVIESNPFEDVTFDSVAIRATVEQAVKRYDIVDVEFARNDGSFRSREFLRLRPGDRLRIRVKLRQARGGALQSHVLRMRIPDSAAGDGFLFIAGQSDGGFSSAEVCLFDHEACASGGGADDSFPELLRDLRRRPQNNDLVADLELFGFDGPGLSILRKKRLDRVVSGFFEIGVLVTP